MRPIELKEKAISMRKEGKTYPEIQNALGVNISKGTLSYWFKDVRLTAEQSRIIQAQNLRSLSISRLKALATKRTMRHQYLESMSERVKGFTYFLNDKVAGKVVLSILYITEGSQRSVGSITFANSDSYIISLFLHLLRFCYSIDERKLRCTVQCRADQDVRDLTRFWRGITRIPSRQFLKPQIDPRTLGKPTKRAGYKGVCRLNYFSADLALELQAIAKSIHTMGL